MAVGVDHRRHPAVIRAAGLRVNVLHLRRAAGVDRAAGGLIFAGQLAVAIINVLRLVDDGRLEGVPLRCENPRRRSACAALCRGVGSGRARNNRGLEKLSECSWSGRGIEGKVSTPRGPHAAAEPEAPPRIPRLQKGCTAAWRPRPNSDWKSPSATPGGGVKSKPTDPNRRIVPTESPSGEEPNEWIAM